MSGLNEQEANEVLSALLEKGVLAEKLKGKDELSIQTADSDIARALAALSAKGLPRRRLNRMGEVFQKDSMISSPVEEKARYLYALSQELESTLSLIDGVINARVHIVLPDRISIGEAVMPASAAVFIKHDADMQTQGLMQKIKKIVAASIPSLAQENKEKISVELFASQEPKAKTDFESWLGIAVEKHSANRLKTIFVLMLFSNLFVLVGLVYLTFFKGRTFFEKNGNQKIDAAFILNWLKKKMGIG